MARKKATPFRIDDLAGANEALREMAELERDISTVKNRLNKRLDEATSAAAEESAPLKARYELLENSLEAFATLHKEDLFKDRKTLELDFGFLSFRQSSRVDKVNGKITWEQIVERMAEKGYDDGIRVKMEANKAAMMSWPEKKLAEVGATIKVADNFDIEVKQREPGLTQAA